MDNSFNRDFNKEVQQFFGDRFTATSSMSRFEVMIDHFSKKFEIDKEKVHEAYEKTFRLFNEGKIDRFSGYFAAVCKGLSKKEYTQEQTLRYIDYHIKQRKDDQLKEFISKYESGERRVFAPSFGITKKEHNDVAYLSARMELEARHTHAQTRTQVKEKEPAL